MDFMTVNDLQELLYYSVLFTTAEYRSVPCLFHYTSKSNKCCIIKDNHIDLRFTRADCFADKDEGWHIIQVFRDAVEVCLRAQQIDSHFSTALLGAEIDFENICEVLRKNYVFCFSKNENNDYLIQNYACKNNDAGLVIGIQALDIERLSEMKFQNQYPISLIDVLYDKQNLSCYMQSLICRMYQLRAQDDEDLTLCKKIAVNQLAIYCLAYKSSKFQREEETRLIIDYNHIDPQSDCIKPDNDDRYIHVLLGRCFLYDVREGTYDRI